MNQSPEAGAADDQARLPMELPADCLGSDCPFSQGERCQSTFGLSASDGESGDFATAPLANDPTLSLIEYTHFCRTGDAALSIQQIIFSNLRLTTMAGLGRRTMQALGHYGNYPLPPAFITYDGAVPDIPNILSGPEQSS